MSVLAVAGTEIASDVTAQAGGDPAHGEALYQTCELCHSLDANKFGPMHRGVFDRAAGTVPNYKPSPVDGARTQDAFVIRPQE